MLERVAIAALIAVIVLAVLVACGVPYAGLIAALVFLLAIITNPTSRFLTRR